MEYIRILAILVIGGIAYYATQKQEMKSHLIAWMTQAELEFESIAKAGPLKMNWVIAQLKQAYIPAPFRNIIPDLWIERMVQQVFDQVHSFIEVQLEQLVSKYLGVSK